MKRRADLIAAAAITGVVALLIVPVPPALLDLLLAVEIAAGVLVLASATLAPGIVSVSSLPALILLSALLRLALNVSTTRLILSRGRASPLVEAFGRFVIGGDVVVGLVTFAVITLVQLLVIAKGSERIAEVAARFTLDALPGKQMAIDAAVRGGALTEEEAQARRDALSRESQLQGAMDGAMKFVKGDAVAGLAIVAIDLAGGLAIGVLRHGLPLAEALERYAVLTVGDGLVAQLPALAMTLAAGLLVTRAAPGPEAGGLGASLAGELSADRRAVALAGCAAVGVGLVPGIPLIPFAAIGAGLIAGAVMTRARGDDPAAPPRGHGAPQRGPAQQRALADGVTPIGLDLDPELSRALGLGADGTTERDPELIAELLPELRDALYEETGVRFPSVRVRAGARDLPPSSCAIRVKEVPVAIEHVAPGALLAIETPSRLARLGVPAKPAAHPLAPMQVAEVAPEHRGTLEAAGVMVWSPAGVVALHLGRVLRKHARDFVGIHAVSEALERLERTRPALVREAVPKAITLPQLVDVLRRLVDEAVSIRDLETILDAVAEHGPHEPDLVALTELVRGALSLQLAHLHGGGSRRLSVVLLDPLIEDAVRAAIRPVRGGSCLALEPEIGRSIVEAARRALAPALGSGARPAVITTAEIRRFVRKLLEPELPQVPVVSFEELPVDLDLQPLGRVVLDRDS